MSRGKVKEAPLMRSARTGRLELFPVRSNHCRFIHGLMVRDARRRAPHHEGLRPHPEERRLRRVSKDEAIEPKKALEPTPTTGINEDDTSAYVLCRQALDIVLGCVLDTSFRRSRSKSSPSSERPLISFCASIA